MTRNKKRIAIITSALIAASTSALLFVQANQTPSHIIFNNERVNISQAINREGRLFYPIREIVEHAGARVVWTERVQVATVFYNDLEIAMQIGNRTMKIGGRNDVQMSVAPFIENGRTMLPLRYVYEAMGYDVAFNEAQGVPIVSASTTQRQNQTQSSQNLPSWFNSTLHREIVEIDRYTHRVILTSEGIRQLELEIVRITNVERVNASNINRILVADPEMMAYARIRAYETREFNNHTRPNNLPALFPIENLGGTNGITPIHVDPIPEIAQRVVDGWLGSWGHRAVLLSPSSRPEIMQPYANWSAMGAGIYQRSNGSFSAATVFAQTD